MYNYTKEYDEGEDPHFYFSTNNNLTYYVTFRDISQKDSPLNKLYSLDFGELNNSKSKNDPEISLTILHIISEFLNKDNYRVLNFQCDTEDSKQVYRKKLFTKWYKEYNNDDWIKYDYDFTNTQYLLSFIYCSKVYDTELIESEILLTLDALERPKRE